jgi:type I restriction enzyme R subunit
LSDFSRTLGIALSSVTFHEKTNPKTIKKYKKDLKFFQTLRRDVQRRYQETVAFGEYEGRIKKLIDRHVGAGDVEIVVPQLQLFDDSQREAELARLGSDAGRADAMASAMKRTIEERFGDDPAFYRQFSEMLKEVISEWRAHRLSDASYLERVRSLLSTLESGTTGDVPEVLQDREVAQAYFGIVEQIAHSAGIEDAAEFCVDVGLAVDDVVGEEPPVDWVKNDDFKNRIRQEIDDVLFDLKEKYNVPLTLEQMDEICEECLRIAERRRAR